MKILKNIWIYIVLGIGIVVTLLSIGKDKSTKKVKELKDKIKDNEVKTKEVENKIEVVNNEKEQIKSEITNTEKELTIVKETKPKVVKKNGNEAYNTLKERINK
jgi:chromosome segregation ATPase